MRNATVEIICMALVVSFQKKMNFLSRSDTKVKQAHVTCEIVLESGLGDWWTIILG